MEITNDLTSYFERYLTLGGQGSAEKMLRDAQEKFTSVLRELTEDQWLHRYAPDKWSLKEMVQHCIDTERIMAYRALCFARGETVALPGYDENQYAAESEGDLRATSFLLSEYEIVRASSVMLFNSFSEKMLLREGTFSGNYRLKVVQFAQLIAGHDMHHLQIVQERYLN